MKVLFGYFTVFILISGFSLSLIGTMKELNKKVSLPEILDQAINIDTMNIEETSFIKDQNGEIFSEIYGATNRISLPYNEIPQNVVDAFLATEDQHFYEHKGFDFIGIMRALFINAKSDSIEQGGSTITQQLVKNVYLNNEKSYNRKLNELLLAYQLEKELSKQKIIELYINTVYFQNNAYGIEAASQFYFSKSACELSLAEATFLAAIPNNPSYYNPLIHYEHTKQRQQLVLNKMLEAGLVTTDEYEQAESENITLTKKEKTDLFPNYVTYIYEELTQLIAEEKGYRQELQSAGSQKEKAEIEKQLNQDVDHLLKSGITIETALNPVIQRKAEVALQETLQNNDIEGAIVVINHHTHEIAAIVGGKDYQKHDFHRAFQSYRQPGSAIKPLLVYAPYIDVFNSSPTSMIDAGPFCKYGYCPKNASGGSYGHVSIETALKYSYNTAAVRIFDQTGIDKSFSYLDAFQFSKIVPEDFHLPAAIGGFTYGVTPLELTSAYTVFSNDGRFKRSHAIRRVLDSQGNVLYNWQDSSAKTVWDVETNNKMRFLLHKVVTEGTGKKAYFSTASYIGGKTGTTNEYKDLWFIGLTEDFSTGVWIGKDHPESIENFSSRAPHLAIWKSIMKDLSK